SFLTEEAKHPSLLPKASCLTSLIINHYHLTFLHAGPKLVISMLRQKFWIMSDRDAVRRTIFSCIPYTRHKAKHPIPSMGILPEARVQLHRVFSRVGLDFGGPFLVKECKRRNIRTTKVFISVFICMAVKAIHVEVVSDLTTAAFLAAMDRFVARLGVPTELYSDCGTNYVGAARQLKTLLADTEVQNQLSSRIEYTWHFNPPAAPHFGGLWEAAIKSVKFHLKHVIGTQILTYEEFQTVVTRVEGILNSTPLTPVSTDPHDFEALTPGHFLIGQPISMIPEKEVTSVPINRPTRWQLLLSIASIFLEAVATEVPNDIAGPSKMDKGVGQPCCGKCCNS
ncbi:Integrase catalytic domain-containing protein, partial [Aphis craccivora]